MSTSLLPKPQIFDDLFMKFMESISDEAISFQEYKLKWEENKRFSLRNLSEVPNVLQEKTNPPSFANLSNCPSRFEEDTSMVTLEDFMRKNHSNALSEFGSMYRECVLFRINSKSMILLFIALAYFKTLIDNFKDKTFEDLIKKLEFFKYQVNRAKQLKLIEVFKGLRNKIEANFPSNAFHSLITSLIKDKVFREGVIDLIQEIIVDLILNCNFHHIIQNRNIELKKFILQLRNSRNEEELLTEEMKTLISRCFLINFNISNLNLLKNSLVKESFTAKPQVYSEVMRNSREVDIWNQQAMDFLVVNNKENDRNISYVILRQQDYENFFLTKLNLPNSVQSAQELTFNNFIRNEGNLFGNKENFDRKMSINSSFVTNDILGLEGKGVHSPKETIRKKQGVETKSLVSSLTMKKLRNLMGNLEEDSKNLEKSANL